MKLMPNMENSVGARMSGVVRRGKPLAANGHVCECAERAFFS